MGEAKYGTKAWDDYWSKLDGDGELYWLDAHLTEKGKQQVRKLRSRQVLKHIPLSGRTS